MPHCQMVRLVDSVSALLLPARLPGSMRMHAAGARPVRSAGGDRLALSLGHPAVETPMTNQPHQPYLSVPLGQVADSSSLWDLVLQEVVLPEGPEPPSQADDQG